MRKTILFLLLTIASLFGQDYIWEKIDIEGDYLNGSLFIDDSLKIYLIQVKQSDNTMILRTSTDEGNTWDLNIITSFQFSDNLVASDDGNFLFSAINNTLYRLNIDTKKGTVIADDLYSSETYNFADNKIVYCDNSKNIKISENAGEIWTTIPVGTEIKAVNLAKTNDGFMLFNTSSGIANLNLANNELSFIPTPLNNNSLYVEKFADTLYVFDEGTGLYVSGNNGADWELRSAERGTEFMVDSDGNLIKMTFGYVISYDHGFTWKPIGLESGYWGTKLAFKYLRQEIKIARRSDYLLYKGVLASLEPIETGNFFPLHSGNKWRYYPSEQSNYLSKTFEVKGKETFGDNEYYKYCEVDSEGNIKSYEWMRYENGVVYVYDASTGQEVISVDFTMHDYYSYKTEELFPEKNDHLYYLYNVTDTINGVPVRGYNTHEWNQYYLRNVWFQDDVGYYGMIKEYEPHGYRYLLRDAIIIDENQDTTIVKPELKLSFLINLYDNYNSIKINVNIIRNTIQAYYLDSLRINYYFKKGNETTPTMHETYEFHKAGSTLPSPNLYTTNINKDYLNNGYTLFIQHEFLDNGIIPEWHTSKWGQYINGLIVGVEDETSQKPEEYSLAQNYPNPFNPVTKISYSIKEAGNVTVKIYDILGNTVEKLVDEYKPAGSYEVNFNGSSLSSGVYFYEINAGAFRSIKKMVLMK